MGEQRLAGGALVGERQDKQLADVATAMVRLHKDYYGKGPTSARAHLAGDTVVVLLSGGYTRGEHTLQQHGETARVEEGRDAMQDIAEGEMREAVESIFDRKVVAFMSGNDANAEIQAELFVLEPQD